VSAFQFFLLVLLGGTAAKADTDVALPERVGRWLSERAESAPADDAVLQTWRRIFRDGAGAGELWTAIPQASPGGSTQPAWSLALQRTKVSSRD
jgi:hypothetical protein